jgi:hypothetical protein
MEEGVIRVEDQEGVTQVGTLLEVTYLKKVGILLGVTYLKKVGTLATSATAMRRLATCAQKLHTL